MIAWVEAAKASTENSLTFKAVDSRRHDILRALPLMKILCGNCQFHNTEDTIPPEAVPVEMEDRAVDKAFRVKAAVD
jgi:hypothetical protein